LPENATCIPGSSIRIRSDRGWQQGPDAVLADVQLDGESVEIEILRPVEVKAYRQTAKNLGEQLAKHRRRFKAGDVHLLAETQVEHPRWLPWSPISENPNRKEFLVTRCNPSGSLVNVCVVPARRRIPPKGRDTDSLWIRMPWFPQGFRWMGLHFSLWLIENFGRVEAPDDYDRGPEAWRRLLPRLLKSKQPSRHDKAAAKPLLDILESRGRNPDEFWTVP